MTPEQEVLEDVRECINLKDRLDRHAIEQLAARLRTILQTEPVHGPLALALVGAEMACMSDEVAASFPALPNLPRC